MDLTPYVTALREDLAVAAEAGGPDARALAERLAAPLESAARLVLLDALSAAADEISSELAPGSVELRLRGREPGFAVTPAPSGPEAFTADVPPPVAAEGDDTAAARINLRLGEGLKGRIEDAAAQAGLSVNAWLVRAAAAALQPPDHAGRTDRSGRGGQRYSGWVR